MMLTHGRIAVIAAVLAASAVGCFGPAAPAPTPTPTLDIQSMVEAAIDKAFAPTPTPTPDIQSMVAAAVNATLAAAATPAPTYRPRPTPTPRSIYAPVPTITPSPTSTRRPTPTPISIYAPVRTYAPRPTPASPPSPTVIRFTIQPPRVTIVRATPTPVPSRLQAVQCGPPCYEQSVPVFPPVDWISGPTISETGVIELVAVLDDGVEMGTLGRASGGNFSVTDNNNILYGTIVAPIAPGWEWTPEPDLWIAEQFDYVANMLRVRAQIDPAAATHPGLRLCLWSGRHEGDRSLLDCVRVRQP